ncbi:MAG: hypothetical protein AB7P22_17815 [Vicinamibacterales bacterium]
MRGRVALGIMRLHLALLTLGLAGTTIGLGAQSAPPRPGPAAGFTRETPVMTCPDPLGPGIDTARSFCDVVSGTDPKTGIVITLPPHRGAVTLSFDLHNRHTYSEEEVRSNRAFTRYTAVIGVLAMDNTLISRAAVQSEFRRASDLVDRVGGGAGPGGVKAVAPTGTERITIEIPEREQAVSILGEILTIERADGTATYSTPGRPIAVISDVTIDYRPTPARRPGG